MTGPKFSGTGIANNFKIFWTERSGMKLLQTMLALQEREGWLSDETLKQLAKETGEPLYRLEGLRSFYPVFQEKPGAKHVVEVCRDVVCRMQGAPAFRETLLEELKQDPDRTACRI